MMVYVMSYTKYLTPNSFAFKFDEKLLLD